MDGGNPRILNPYVWAALLLALCSIALTGGNAAAGPHVEALGDRASFTTDTPTPTPTCPPSWSIVPSPNIDPDPNRLNAISAVSANDVWAVGYSRQSISRGLIMRWNGSSWNLVPTPSLPGPFELWGVEALASNDVWAVGYYWDATAARTLTLHWDGANWAVIPSPNIGSVHNYLLRVSAVSANDVWAVGVVMDGGGITMHWNGTAWSIVPNPTAGQDGTELWGVDVLASDDVWAVGWSSIGGTHNNLTLHWNGTAWAIVPSPIFEEYSQLYGVAAISANDVWAVGTYAGPKENSTLTLTIHWNGSVWSVVPSPNAGTGSNALGGVAAVSANDVWAVGYGADTASGYTLAMHWNGTAWSIAPRPALDKESYLLGIDVLSSTDIWAAGWVGDFGKGSTLVQRYFPVCTPTATPTGASSNTATLTPTSTRSTTATHTAIPTVTCQAGWEVVNSPNFGSGNNYLYSLDVIAPNDIWAVGSSTVGTLTMHWDGTMWSIVPSPGQGSLTGVSGVASNDVWVVGNAPQNQLQAAHWTGSAWNPVPIPSPGYNYAQSLAGVEAVSGTDAWAVGFYRYNSPQGLFMRWNGGSWGMVSSPYNPAVNAFSATETIAPNDVWAAGAIISTSPSTSLLFHWDGTVWTHVPSPNVGGLSDVEGSAANDVWAVGSGGTMHWDGSTWSVVPSPATGPLYGVEVVAPNDVWAVGLGGVGGGGIIHWDGSQWSVVPTPSPPGPGLVLRSIDAVSAGEIWAAGYYMSIAGPEQTYVLRYSSTCGTPAVTATPTTTTSPAQTPTGTTTGSPTPTPTHTGTRTATRTGTIPTLTATAVSTLTATSVATLTETSTPTPCSITFTDVATTDYFYEPVRYLFCAGAISGYADNTFRPYNYTTRSQLTKIVVLAEAWSIDTSGGPHFNDVSETHPFYSFVETAYNRGIISGYDCGTEGEPCPGRYFRWAGNVTRGQLSKIIVQAEGWPVDTTGGPHFNDVPADSPFYPYVETAYAHGIISGYACGGGGEPCPGLYFRWGNNATRGQIAKIVYSAITMTDDGRWTMDDGR